MSNHADDIAKALLAGTLGIGEHGIAEPLEGVEPSISGDISGRTFPAWMFGLAGARITREPLGYIDEDGAWRPRRNRNLLYEGDLERSEEEYCQALTRQVRGI